jgi:hypothetical protein
MLPLAALIETLLQFREKKNSLLIVWFAGLTLFLIFMTTSLVTYRPLDLRSSWYVYPLIFPVIILSSILIHRFKKVPMYLLLFFIFISGMYMSYEYQKFFNLGHINEFKEYLKENPAVEIYTDHHTKYGIDLIDGYPEKLRTNIILNKAYSLSQIPSGSLIIYNFDRISELELQGYSFPDFSELKKGRYFKEKIFGQFQIFSVVNSISFNRDNSKKYPKSLPVN